MSAPQREAVFHPETRTYFDLIHTHSCITTKSAELFREHEITEQQYHVLRILDEAGPGGLPCLEIARRLPTVAPDITRLLERMRRGQLIRRERLEADRRVVMIELAPKGTRALARVEPALEEFHRERLALLSHDELEQLGQLLRKARGEL